MRIFSSLRYTVVLLAVLCVSCGTALPTIKPYKLEVQQGNVVTSKMLLQLRPGMTKSQVRFVMGTPLIQDSFHGNRWDYVYQMREKGKIIEQRRVILDFDGEALKAVRGDVIPKGSELKSDEGNTNTGARVINPTDKPAKKGMLDKLKFWQKDEAASAKEAEDAKAKLEAQEAAKNADEQAKENLRRQSATPIEEPQSIMAVPLDVLPMPAGASVVAPVAPTTIKADEALPIVEPIHNDLPVTRPASQPVEDKLVPAKEADHAVRATPAKTQPVDTESLKAVTEPTKPYNSTSGMDFDEDLKTVKGTEVKTVPEQAMPRAGNKTIPKPKDLPAENEPSFFDRMLEKIGF
jgi:outer membrane protein assembly factor BamE